MNTGLLSNTLTAKTQYRKQALFVLHYGRTKVPILLGFHDDAQFTISSLPVISLNHRHRSSSFGSFCENYSGHFGRFRDPCIDTTLKLRRMAFKLNSQYFASNILIRLFGHIVTTCATQRSHKQRAHGTQRCTWAAARVGAKCSA